MGIFSNITNFLYTIGARTRNISKGLVYMSTISFRNYLVAVQESLTTTNPFPPLSDLSDPTNRRGENFRNTQKGLDTLMKLFETKNVTLVPFGMHPAYNRPVYIYEYASRWTVVVNRNNLSLPFYWSTGLGGKENVPAEKWYPFFGIGPDGWLNKGTEAMILEYYGSNLLKNIAQALNTHLPRPQRNPVNIAGWNAATQYISETQFTNVVNKDLSPVANRDDNLRFLNNINTVLKKLGVPHRYELKGSSSPTRPDGSVGATRSTREPITGRLTLSNNDGKKLEFNVIASDVGRPLVRNVFKDEDAQFYSDVQYTLKKTPENTWRLIHNTNATNSTLVDGAAVTAPIILTKGMRISVGNPVKKIEKLPLIAS